MIRILVADKLAPAGLEKLQNTEGVEIDVKIGLDPDQLAREIPNFDGMIIRSGVTITAESLANPGKLRGIARAGVGVDNVDLAAATAAGVLVMNTPDANTVSTAEHTMALLLSTMRRIPDAHAHVRSGAWKRGDYVGKQLSGKTLAIVGLGRVGQAVARRAIGCDMRVIGYDPLIGAPTVLDGAVTLYEDFDAFLADADCVTLHAKLTDKTRHMLSTKQFAALKSSAVVINCARGDLIDESALADALNNGEIAAAAVDVYSAEPPKDNPLLAARNIVCTPHLGASTEEAQLAVAMEAVNTLLDYLCNGEIRSAVNVVGLPSHLTDRDRAYLDLTMRMSDILAAWCAEGISGVCLTTCGDNLQTLCPTLARQSMIGLLAPHTDVRLNLVNAASVAKERGIHIDYAARPQQDDYFENIQLTIKTRDGEHHVEGAVFADGRPRILAIDDYRMELVPEKQLVLIFNDDRPGVIGLVGNLFGDRGINIADMTLSRRDNKALMLLKLDQQPDDAILTQLRNEDNILSVQTVLLPSLVNSGSAT